MAWRTAAGVARSVQRGAQRQAWRPAAGGQPAPPRLQGAAAAKLSSVVPPGGAARSVTGSVRLCHSAAAVDAAAAAAARLRMQAPRGRR